MAPKSLGDLTRLADLRVRAADAELARAHAALDLAKARTLSEIELLEQTRLAAADVRQTRIRAVLGRPSSIAQVSRIALAYDITEDEIRLQAGAVDAARHAETAAHDRLVSAQSERARCLLRQRKLEHMAEQLAIAAASETEFREELETGL